MKTVKSKDGTTIAYDVYGTGPVLIFITGAICSRKFGPVEKDAKVFAEQFTVFNYDRRGRGDSSNTLPYTMQREIEDIEALIDASGGQAFLYGHSSGAVLALESAIALPTKVRKIVMFDTPYVHNEEYKKEYAVLTQEVVDLIKAGKNKAVLQKFLSGIGMPKAFIFFLPLFPGWQRMKALAPTVAYDMFMTGDLPPLARAENVSVPVHLVCGSKSPESIQQVALQLAKVIPNAHVLKLENQDHMVNPKVLLPVLNQFLLTS